MANKIVLQFEVNAGKFEINRKPAKKLLKWLKDGNNGELTIKDAAEGISYRFREIIYDEHGSQAIEVYDLDGNYNLDDAAVIWDIYQCLKDLKKDIKKTKKQK